MSFQIPMIILNGYHMTSLNIRQGVLRVMTRLKQSSFTTSDIDFLKEYAQAMSAVALALDKIQGEDHAYLGSLLPIVASAILKLKDLQTKPLQFCKSLVDAVLDGLLKRFRPLLEDHECQLAAGFHPKFRLFWLGKYDQSLVRRVRSAMERAVESALCESSAPGSDNGSDSSAEEMVQDELFQHIAPEPSATIGPCRTSMRNRAQDLVDKWLKIHPKDTLCDATFLNEPVLTRLFVKFNTAIPSSAAVERFFSMGKDILRDKRASLSDKNFEMLMFLKGNMHLMESLE
jgi:hypothetical protein